MATNDDHSKLVFMLLHEIHAPKIVSAVIHAAYDAGYERLSDGITLMPELGFSGFKMKHPAGVGHDWLYWLGMENPFLPESANTGYRARKWCDDWFCEALKAFNHPIRSRVWWLGLRLGGWVAWNRHRKTEQQNKRAI